MTRIPSNFDSARHGEHRDGESISEAEQMRSTTELGEMSSADRIDQAGDVLAMATEGETPAQADETVRDLVEQAELGYADHTLPEHDAEAAVLVGLLEANQGGLRTAAAIDVAPTEIVDEPFRVFEEVAGSEATQKLAGTIEGAEMALQRLEEELTERPDHQVDSMIPVDLNKHVEGFVTKQQLPEQPPQELKPGRRRFVLEKRRPHEMQEDAKSESMQVPESVSLSERVVAETLSKTENLGVLTSVALTEEEMKRAGAEYSAGFQNFGANDDSMAPFRKAADRRNKMGEYIDITRHEDGQRETVFYTFRSMYLKDDIGRPGNMVEICFDLPRQEVGLLVAQLGNTPNTIQNILEHQMAGLHLPERIASSVANARAVGEFDGLTYARHSPDGTVQGERSFKYAESIDVDHIVSTTSDRLPWKNPERNVQLAESPESSMPPQPESYDKIAVMYGNLLSAEMRLPEAEDVYQLTDALSPVELARLSDAGVSAERIASNKLTRSELQSAGFFFANKLGGGEKGIVEAAIPDPESEGGVLDLRGRSFLTREELQKVYVYQQENGMGLEGHDVNAVRADALLMLNTIGAGGVFRPGDNISDTLPADINDPKWHLEDSRDRQKVLDYRKKLYEGYLKNGMTAERAAMAVTHTVEPKPDISRYRRGGRMTALGTENVGRGNRKFFSQPLRTGKLVGSNSPFLDRGFRFTSNPDAAVRLPDGKNGVITRRFNMANIHLMGGHEDFPGLSEMGQADWDQNYMSTGEFVRELFAGKPSEADQGIQNEDIASLNEPAEIRRWAESKYQQNLLTLARQQGL